MVVFLICFTSLLLISTLIPFVKKEYWIFRIFEYPRLQKLMLTILCIILWFFFLSQKNNTHFILLALLLLNVFYLIYLIFPFTPLAKVQVLKIDREISNNGISVMIANVYQENKNYNGCLVEVSKANPDVLLLVETGTKWELETRVLENEYPFSVKIPLDNTYGMILYSKFELQDACIHYLVEEGVPSIHTKIKLKNNKLIQLYAVHPTPPVPNENPTSAERDKELLLIADLAKKSEIPVIVIGDLNDVAWSFTTKLFLKMSGLLDPRRGRGFFNTFHAHYFFLRFPLDHAFISVDLKLKKIQRMDNFNSDHFPMYLSLQYEEQAKEEQESMQPDADDIETAEKKKNAV